jgi:hypothetical protein
LPAELSGLVGRRDDVRRVLRRLSGSRLVTLTGAAGVGKSRLALRSAAAAAQSYPDGAWYADLSALPGPGLLAQSLAAACGVPGDRTAADPAEALAAHLAGRELLLLADNCEHLLPAWGILLTELLRTAPGLRILATSREVLNVTGEYVYSVAPLAVPESDLTDPGSAAAWSALALFAERAGRASPGFTVTAANIARCPPPNSPTGSTTGSPCSTPAATGLRPATRPCARRSSGATSCAGRPNSCCGSARPCSPGGSGCAPPSGSAPAANCPVRPCSKRSPG